MRKLIRKLLVWLYSLTTRNVIFIPTWRAAEMLNRAESTLRVWRSKGYGPNVFLINNRLRYDLDEIEKFRESPGFVLCHPGCGGGRSKDEEETNV